MLNRERLLKIANKIVLSTDNWLTDVLSAETPALACRPSSNKTAKKKVAIEFPTQDAFDAYMKKHPKADPRKHTVKKTENKKPEKQEENQESANKTQTENQPANNPANNQVVKKEPTPIHTIAHFKGWSEEEANEFYYKNKEDWSGHKGSETALLVLARATEEIASDYSTMHSKDDTLLGLIATTEKDDSLYIDFLTTHPESNGVGVNLIAETIHSKLKPGKRLELHSLPEAEGFYEKIGMKKEKDGEDAKFIMEYDKAVEFADKVKKEMKNWHSVIPQVKHEKHEKKPIDYDLLQEIDVSDGPTKENLSKLQKAIGSKGNGLDEKQMKKMFHVMQTLGMINKK